MKHEDDLKKEFGKLGLYLIEKAESEIKDIERKQVLLNSSLKKRKNERLEIVLDKKQKQFRNQYLNQINESTVSILLEVKSQLLELKNKLVFKFKEDFLVDLKNRIKNNYDKYINYLLELIKEKVSNIKDNSKKITLIFNSTDYNYFEQHKNMLEALKNVDFDFKKASNEFIGGYILDIPIDSYTYNYTLESQIKLKTNAIESILTKNLSSLEERFYDLEDKFEQRIEDLRKEIEVYLKNLKELAKNGK